MRCYTCVQLGHMSWDFPENVVRQRGAQVVQVEVESPKVAQVVENFPKEGESLIMRKVLLKVGEDTGRSVERRNLLEIYCKARGKCCKLIIDSGNTDNLVSIEMVDKMNLNRKVHPKIYRVTWMHKKVINCYLMNIPS